MTPTVDFEGTREEPTPAEAPKWDVLGAHDEMVRLHGESCDCDVCLVIQEKADAALAATPAEEERTCAWCTQSRARHDGPEAQCPNRVGTHWSDR